MTRDLYLSFAISFLAAALALVTAFTC